MILTIVVLSFLGLCAIGDYFAYVYVNVEAKKKKDEELRRGIENTPYTSMSRSSQRQIFTILSKCP